MNQKKINRIRRGKRIRLNIREAIRLRNIHMHKLLAPMEVEY